MNDPATPAAHPRIPTHPIGAIRCEVGGGVDIRDNIMCSMCAIVTGAQEEKVTCCTLDYFESDVDQR
jgi:hypothetical protein